MTQPMCEHDWEALEDEDGDVFNRCSKCGKVEDIE